MQRYHVIRNACVASDALVRYMPSGRGRVFVTLSALSATLGEPSLGASHDGKIRVEWVIQVGTRLLTIYDYKDTTPLDNLTQWHVGANFPEDDVRRVLAGILPGVTYMTSAECARRFEETLRKHGLSIRLERIV